MENTNNTVKRSYAKYVFLDVVNFSKRSAEAQSEIVQHLVRLVRESLALHDIKADEHCILIPTGDGMCIALLNQAIDYDKHIQLALTILGLLVKHNSEIEDESRRFDLRFGINQNTDILVTDINDRNNVAGAGINLAARIMSKADAGQILVSDSVFQELQPSEAYMGKFKEFTASAKGVSFRVHQYVAESYQGLNTVVPSAFISVQPKKTLSEETAYYFEHAISLRQMFLKIKGSTFFSNDAAVVLLARLANDSLRKSKTTEVQGEPSPRTHGAGKLTVEEQYEYYASQDFWTLDDAANFIVHGDSAWGSLRLNDFAECFEYSDYLRHYAFLNAQGVKKLQEDWPTIAHALHSDE